MLQSGTSHRTIGVGVEIAGMRKVMAGLHAARRHPLPLGLAALAVVLGVSGGVTAWVMLAPAEQAATDARTSAAGPATARRQTSPVQVGSIAATVNLDARVASTEELPLSFQSSGVVKTLQVVPGQVVRAGEVLAELDSTQVSQELTLARSRLEVATLKLQQAQAQARLHEREERARIQTQLERAETALRLAVSEQARIKAGPSALDWRQAESAVTAAQAEVRRAESELARLGAGPPPAEVQAAQQQISSARLAAQRAQNQMDRLNSGPDPAAVRAAEQQVAQARVNVQRSEADLASVMSGPDQVALRTAEREFANAQSNLTRAQADLERMSRPDPVAMAAAERDVQRAEATLRGARNMKTTKDTKAAQQTAVTNAQLTLQDAIARRDQLRAGPQPWEIEVARRNFQVARSALEDARVKLETARQGPDAITINAATATAEGARISLADAEARLQALMDGPPQDMVDSATDAIATARATANSAQSRYAALVAGPPRDQVAQANDALTAARVALEVAVARVEELRAHPSEDELRDAQAQVEKATVAAEKARAEAANPPSESDNPAAYDARLLAKPVAQEQTEVDILQKQLDGMRLVAPSDGVIAQVKTTVGTTGDPSAPAVILARAGDTIIAADLSERDSSALQAGQGATIEIADQAPIGAEVLTVTDGAAPASRLLRLRPAWDVVVPAIGTPARVSVVTQQHDQALLIPQRAVKSSGPRRYVDIVDGIGTRTATVTEGIAANGMVEILSGLTAGQSVVVTP